MSVAAKAPEAAGSLGAVTGTGGENVEIAVVREPEAVEALRPEWLPLLGSSITTHPDYYRGVVANEPQVEGPYILTLRRNGVLEALLLGRFESVPMRCKLGYRTVYAPRVRAITIVYEGFIGRTDDENAAALVRELRAALQRGDADVLLFRHVKLGDPLRRAATEGLSFLERQHFGRTTVCWERTLPDSGEDFTSTLSKKTRSGVTRYMNRLRRDFGDDVTMRVFSSPDELDEMFRDLEQVASKTYQRGLGAGFRDEAGYRQRTQLSMEHGWFRAWVLYVHEVPVAFWPGEGFAGRFRSGIPGYDPAYEQYRVGTYVLMRMIEDLCEDPSISLLDFGFGDAEYKRRYGDKSWEEEDVLVFARRLRPAWVNAVHTGFQGANALAFSVGRRLGVFSRIKNWWRGRLRAAPEQ
jgi:CelD/BcsL family acetyltransferase involved in cellulose biosynthesis